MSDATKRKEKQKWAIEKPKLDNARRLRGIFYQWLPPCLARHAREASMVRPVARPMSLNQNLRVSWKPVNPQECVFGRISTELS